MYYLVIKDTETHKMCEDLNKRIVEAKSAVVDAVKQIEEAIGVSAKSVLFFDNQYIGGISEILFEQKPKGWIKGKFGGFKPKKSDNIFKKFFQLQSLPAVDRYEIERIVNYDCFDDCDGPIFRMGFSHVPKSSNFFISISEKANFVASADLKEITKTEYDSYFRD